jgi:hypothetical protein
MNKCAPLQKFAGEQENLQEERFYTNELRTAGNTQKKLSPCVEKMPDPCGRVVAALAMKEIFGA